MCNKAIVFIVNLEYVDAFKVALYSFHKYNKTFAGEIVVFYDEDIVVDVLDSIVSKFKFKTFFRKLNKTPYEDLKFTGAIREWKFNPAYRYEIFLLDDYEQILYLDCDIIITNDITDIFNKKCNFGACRLNAKIEHEYSDSKGFNGGVLLIGKRYLNSHSNRSLIDISKRYLDLTGNQIVLNKFFCKKVKYLEQAYNVTTDIVDENLYRTGKIFHFIGENKPWNSVSIETSFNKYVLKTSGGYILLRLYLKYKAMQKEANTFYKT